MKVNIKRDGLNLVGELFVPDQESYDLVIICHGFTGHRNEDHISWGYIISGGTGEIWTASACTIIRTPWMISLTPRLF